MKLIVLSSSSKANGYLISNGIETIIIECGVKLIEVQKVLDFDLTSVSGCVLTHYHADHMGFIEQYLEAGIPVYCSEDTRDNWEFKGLRRPIIRQPQKAFMVGNFKVVAFETVHDAVGSFGYVINHKNTGAILFITDSYYSKYRFENLSHVLCEANFCPDILEKRIDSGSIPRAAVKRLTNSHMSIKTCKKFLLANDLSQVRNIVLIHLSSLNSNAKDFREEIIKATGKNVIVADKNIEVDFNLNSF